MFHSVSFYGLIYMYKRKLNMHMHCLRVPKNKDVHNEIIKY